MIYINQLGVGFRVKFILSYVHTCHPPFLILKIHLLSYIGKRLLAQFYLSSGIERAWPTENSEMMRK